MQVVATLLTANAFAAPSMYGTYFGLAIAQQLSSHLQSPCVVMITRGAISFGGGRFDAGSGGSWGFGRVLRLEHTTLRVQMTDISVGPRMTAHLALSLSKLEAEATWRQQTLAAARVRVCATTPSARTGFTWCGQCMVSGGLGGLGLRGAALLVECGAHRVLLASRSGRVVRDGELSWRLEADS